jgi:large subunit ribosomal protein L23
MILKPISTEKAVMMIERDNLLTFTTELTKNKEEIKKEIEELFEIKVDSIRTLRKNNKKYVYVKLNKKFPAIDVASKLGLM